MPCFRPLTGFRSRIVNPTGKRSIVFNAKEALDRYVPVTLPCGRCIHCKLEKSRQWAMRIMHEASLYKSNCFLTLTYNDEHLPKNRSIDKEAPVLFMKRLRDRFGSGIRSYGCAEYGEDYFRPHYHLCIFNHDFEDKKIWSKREEVILATSETLNELWPFGFSTIGSLTFESAAYVARYCTKKIDGGEGSNDLEFFDGGSGEVFSLTPERSVCVSRRPGIGRAWYEQFGKHSQAHDFVIMNGKKLRPAKYYDRLFDIADPERFAKVKRQRRKQGERATQLLDDQQKMCNKSRLSMMEECSELQFKQKNKRGFENG